MSARGTHTTHTTPTDTADTTHTMEPAGAAPIPHPDPTALEAPFWEACRAHELRIQRCAGCGTFRHHPRPRCPKCRSDRYDWAPVRGTGTVHSWTVCHPPVLPGYADRVPYNAVVVRLDEGVYIVSNLVDCDDDAIEVDMRVEVVFVDVDDELTLAQFRPLG